jgi:hypothetical protein
MSPEGNPANEAINPQYSFVLFAGIDASGQGLAMVNLRYGRLWASGRTRKRSAGQMRKMDVCTIFIVFVAVFGDIGETSAAVVRRNHVRQYNASADDFSGHPKSGAGGSPNIQAA